MPEDAQELLRLPQGAGGDERNSTGACSDTPAALSHFRGG
jgi:hypothetical protein